MSNYNKTTVDELINEYLKRNKVIYPIEIARILGIENKRAEILFTEYRRDTKDVEKNSVDAVNFFKYYFKRKHRKR